MSSPMRHVADVTERVGGGLLRWATRLIDEAGLGLPVHAGVPTEPGPPALILLPYQIVMESQSGVPTVPLMPTTGESKREAIPAPWRALSRGMTEVLVEQFPKRGARAPGIGPLDPCPRLDELPEPLAAWYRAHPDWLVGEDRGKLPQISWRQPFSLAIRYAGLVLTEQRGPAIDVARLSALAVLAAGVRQERYFSTTVPARPQEPPLAALVDAMALAAPEPLATELREAAAASRADDTLAVGLFAHHDLSDQDLALVMTALRVPMQPAVVFGVRLSLGAGPILLPGAMPHLGKVEGNR